MNGKICYNLLLINDWTVSIYIAKEEYDLDFILDLLLELRCPNIYDIFRDIEFTRYNIGFTYTNSIKKQSLIIIGLQDDESLLINTVAHEARHLQLHIANVEGLDQNSETVCYLIGYIVLKIYEQCEICLLL